MERAGARLGFDFHGAGAISAILCAIVGSEDFEFGDGLRIRIDVQGSVASIIHVVAAIKLPVVVLGAAPIHAIGHVAVDADLGVVLTRLADHAGRQINELREIASVEHEVIDLLAGDGAGEIGRSGFDLGNGFAGNFNCLRNSPDSELHVNAGLFGNGEYDLLYGEFLKTLGSHDQIIGIARQTGNNVCTVGV